MKSTFTINAGQLMTKQPDSIRFGRGANLEDILFTVLRDIEFGEELDIDDLLAEEHAIAIIISTTNVFDEIRDDLTEEQAWSLLQAFRDRTRWSHQFYHTALARLASEIFPRISLTDEQRPHPAASTQVCNENTNCLEGIACPECGNCSRVLIEAKSMAAVTDDGAETFGDMEWDDASYAECPGCHYYGTLGQFRIPPTHQTSTQAAKE